MDQPSPSPQRKPCKGCKVKHPTLDRALRHAAALEIFNARKGRNRPGCRLKAYFCESCSAFHVGHEPIPQPIEESPQ